MQFPDRMGAIEAKHATTATMPRKIDNHDDGLLVQNLLAYILHNDIIRRSLIMAAFKKY
jgi:hypothetical protein